MTRLLAWWRGRRTGFVLRDSTPVVAFVLAAVVGLILVIDPLVVGAPVAFVATAPLVAGALGVLWLVLVHPHVRYDERMVTVTGIGRLHRIPWARIATVRQQFALAFALDDGRMIRASAVTAPRDSGVVASAVTRGRFGVGAADAHTNADALRAYRDTHVARAPIGPSPAVVETQWDVVPLAVVAGLVALALIDVIVLTTR